MDLYKKALAADAKYQDALMLEYGKAASEMRYKTNELPRHLRLLAAEKRLADEHWLTAMRHARQSVSE